MLYNVVTAVCLALLVVQFVIFFGSIVLKKRKQKITFIRDFKKGRVAFIYLIAIPLYWAGNVYAGLDYPKAFFASISKVVNLVVLKYDTTGIDGLMAHSDFYKWTVYFCFLMVAVNAAFLTLSLTAKRLWCKIGKLRITLTKKNKIYIFGNNPGSEAIYLSDKEKRSKAIIGSFTPEEEERLYMERIFYIPVRSEADEIKKLIRLSKAADKENVFIINTGDDEKNIMLCTAVIEELSRLDEELRRTLFLTTKVFVFGDPTYQAIYEDIISDGHGCIHYVNKYQKMAMDFIDRYPLALFMNKEQLDFSTSCVREGVDVNMLLIGFGRVNQQIFLTSVANNQFITTGGEYPEAKLVNYHIFDKEKPENNKNLNHSYYRYEQEFTSVRSEDYLPLPAHPAEEHHYHIDVNSAEFYGKLREILLRNPKAQSFAVISFGTDLENLDMAQKLVEKRSEWGVSNLTVFVRVKVWHKEQTLLEQEGCYFICNERDTVFDIDKIMSGKIFKMAKLRNEIYDLEYEITENPSIATDEKKLMRIKDDSYESWFKAKSQMERESSLYCCLSLRSKLNMMGLDYRPESKDGGLSEKEYLEVYAKGDLPVSDRYSYDVDGKKIIHYGIDFAPSRRRNMAVQEHQRWNAFMFSHGMIPATIEQIKSEQVRRADGSMRYTNGRNYSVRRHGNLTTFEGLEQFRRIVAQRDKVSEEKRDVIKYDYQILDDAYWLLTCCGYEIFKIKE